jgi:predicted transcriptional regulator
MPGIGPKPTIDYARSRDKETAKLRYMIDQLIKRRARSLTPILHECETSYELTIGQVRMLHDKGIMLVMQDDLGKYECDLLDNKIVKRRL